MDNESTPNPEGELLPQPKNFLELVENQRRLFDLLTSVLGVTLKVTARLTALELQAADRIPEGERKAWSTELEKVASLGYALALEDFEKANPRIAALLDVRSQAEVDRVHEGD